MGDGVAKVMGLTNLQGGEYVRFETAVSGGKGKKLYGLALNLSKGTVSIAILGNERLVGQGSTVFRSKRLISVPVGEILLGRAIDALGNIIDGKGLINL